MDNREVEIGHFIAKAHGISIHSDADAAILTLIYEQLPCFVHSITSLRLYKTHILCYTTLDTISGLDILFDELVPTIEEIVGIRVKINTYTTQHTLESKNEHERTGQAV